MKVITTILILVFCANHYINAQSYYNKNKISSNKETYECTPTKMMNAVVLINVKNKLDKEKQVIPGNPEDYMSYLSENDGIRNKIKVILGEIIDPSDREKIHNAGNYIIMNFWINDSGRILEMGFSFMNNSLLKPQYLSKIEERIKKEIVFSFSSNRLKGANFIFFASGFGF